VVDDRVVRSRCSFRGPQLAVAVGGPACLSSRTGGVQCAVRTPSVNDLRVPGEFLGHCASQRSWVSYADSRWDEWL
jgi:hypothetical protein